MAIHKYRFGEERQIQLSPGGKLYTVRLEIDTDDLFYWLGAKASKNKSGRAYHLHKAVKVTAKEIK